MSLARLLSIFVTLARTRALFTTWVPQSNLIAYLGVQVVSVSLVMHEVLKEAPEN